MHIESSTVTPCSPPAWCVPLGAAQAGQDQRLLAGDHVRAVELGRDLHGQVERCASPPRSPSVSGVAATKLPPMPKNTLTLPSRMRPDRVDGVEAVLARRLEAELVAQRVEEVRRALLPDAHGAVALHVGVAAHRAQPGARLADVAAQQQHVDDLLDRRDGVAVLGEAHRPADDRRGRTRGSARRRARSARGVSPVGSSTSSQSSALEVPRRTSSKPVVCSATNSVVAPASASIEQRADRLEQRQVAVDPDRQVQVGERRCPCRPARGRLRVVEPHSPASRSGLIETILAPLLLGLLQRGEHPRVVGAGVLADDHDQLGVVDVLEVTAPLPMPIDSASAAPVDSWHMFEQSGRLLVPKRAREQLVDERRLVGRLARRCRRRLRRASQAAQRARRSARSASSQAIGS